MIYSLGFQTKAEIILERLCSEIIDGHVRPGERLNTDALAREFGVSKIPVREALSKLESQGLVVQSPHAGARVAPLSLREMKGIHLIRGRLEGLAAGIAATTATNDEVEDLLQLHNEMQGNYRSGSLAQLSRMNRSFHVKIAQMTRYETLTEMTESTLLKVLRYRVGIHRVTGDWEGVLSQHGAILSALQIRDPEMAERAATEHVERQLQIELNSQIDKTLFVDDLVVETTQ